MLEFTMSQYASKDDLMQALQEEVARLRAELHQTAENARSLATLVDRLQTEQAQWEQDALRYRWLRLQRIDTGAMQGCSGDFLDQSIDEAMSSAPRRRE